MNYYKKLISLGFKKSEFVRVTNHYIRTVMDGQKVIISGEVVPDIERSDIVWSSEKGGWFNRKLIINHPKSDSCFKLTFHEIDVWAKLTGHSKLKIFISGNSRDLGLERIEGGFKSLNVKNGSQVSIIVYDWSDDYFNSININSYKSILDLLPKSIRRDIQLRNIFNKT